MIAAVQTQTETFQVGDYIAPTWTAGADRRGVVVKVFSKGKKVIEWWAEVRWLVGHDTGTTGTIAWRQLHLVWRTTIGASVVYIGNQRAKQCACKITKIHDDGELQLQPWNGQSFKAALNEITISETPEPEPELEDIVEEEEAVARACGALPETEAEPAKLPTKITEANSVAIYEGEAYYSEVKQGAWRLATDAEMADLNKGDRVSEVDLPWVYKFVRLGAIDDRPVAICAFVDYPCFHYRIPVEGLQISGVRNQESEASNYIFGDNPILIDQATFDRFEQTYSGDLLMENKIAGTFRWQECEFVCIGTTSSDELEAVEVVPLSDWDRELYTYQQLLEQDVLTYEGQIVKHKRRELVLTDRQIHLAVAPSESDTELKVDQQPTTNNQQPTTNNQQPTTNNQQPSIDTYEYTPIEPTPVWFSPNGDPDNLVEGQAIATNGKGNVRLVWGEGREADVPGPKVQWSRPERMLAAGFQSVPLSLIVVDPALQPRVQMDEFAIAEYAEAMAAGTWQWEKDPIIGYWDGARLWLSSGGHRCEGARRAGLQTIALEVRLGDRSDALLNAPCANMAHGVRMSAADKNRAIALILRDPKWQQESSRSLSRLLTDRGFRVDHKKIEQIRQGLVASGENPQIEQRIIRRGNQTYTTNAPAVRQDQHSLAEVQALYAALGEFSINGDPTKPYKFECIGVLQRFKSLDEAYEKFAWMRDRVAEKQKEYATTCVNCVKRSDLANGEFECSAFSRIHAVTDDPGAAGCRHYAKKRWCDYPAPPTAKPASLAPCNPAIERPEPPAGAIVTGYSAKDGEEDLQITGAVVGTEGDRLHLVNGGIVYRDAAILEPDPEQEQADVRAGLKQAIAQSQLSLVEVVQVVLELADEDEIDALHELVQWKVPHE